jgi:hypothetical protein
MLAPLWANACEAFTLKGKEDYVILRYFFIMPQMEQKGQPMTPEGLNVIPVVTVMMTRDNFKAVMKRFIGILTQQEEGGLGPIPGMEEKSNDENVI